MTDVKSRSKYAPDFGLEAPTGNVSFDPGRAFPRAIDPCGAMSG